MKGHIIVFEGIDGSGKTSQIQMLADYINTENYSYIVIKGHKAFDGVKEKILAQNNKIDPFSLFLLSMAKFKTISEEISLMRDRVDFIIIDRYVDTAIAYSQANIGSDELPVLNDVVPLLKRVFVLPDVTVFINTPAEVALQRKHNCFDRIELGNGSLSEGRQKHFLRNQRFAEMKYKEIIIQEESKYITIDGKLTKREMHNILIESLRMRDIL